MQSHFPISSPPPRFWQSPKRSGLSPLPPSLLTPDHVLTPTSSFLRDLKTSTSTPPTAQEPDWVFPTAPWHEAATSPASQPCLKEAPAFNRPPTTHITSHTGSKVPPRGQVHGHLPILLLTAPPGHCVPGLARHLAILLLPGHHWALLSPLQDGVSRAVTRPLLMQRSPWRASPGFQFTETPKQKCLLGLSPCESLTQAHQVPNQLSSRCSLPPSVGCLATQVPKPMTHHPHHPLLFHWPSWAILPWPALARPNVPCALTLHTAAPAW